MEKLKQKLSEIEDKRHQGYVKHSLVNILIIVMCATLCGLDELCEIVTFAKSKEDFF